MGITSMVALSGFSRLIPAKKTPQAKQKAFTAAEQPKTAPAQTEATFDASMINEKKPQSDLDVKQRIGRTGETVPIVFGKRVSNVGGVWVQPSLLKSGIKDFKGLFLYAISLGEISSSPTKIGTWVGLDCISFLADAANITLAHNYSTAAALSSSPTTCPINGNGLFCGVDSFSYLAPLNTNDSNFVYREPDRAKYYWAWQSITRGSGDTTNNIFICNLTAIYDGKTGNNITTNYYNWLNLSGGSFGPSTNFYFNASGFDGSGNPTGGNAVGTISGTMTSYVAPLNQTTVDAGTYTQTQLNQMNAVASGSFEWVYNFTFVSKTNQANASNPATSGVLTGVQDSYSLSLYANPSSTTANNSSYADITFLQVVGDIYPSNSSSGGSFSTSTQQLSIFYEQGVKVDLYSAGLSSGSYTNAASNQFIDLAMYLFTLYKQKTGASNADIVNPVDLTNLQALSTFCTTYKLYFNGIISQAVNIVEYISKVSPFFFLSFLSDGGKYKFASILPLNGSNAIDVTALTPTLTFTEANIIPGSFSKTYLSVEDRRDFIANCVYRKAEVNEIGANRTVTVRYPSTSIDAPTEQFDMSDFCTDPDHAAMYAKYELARRKYSTHNISFAAPLLTTALIPTNIIKITRQRKSSTADVDRSETQWYQVSKISHSSTGETEIEASHFPVNGSNVSTISNEVLNGTFTVLN